MFTNYLRALEGSLQPLFHGGKRGAGVYCPMVQALKERWDRGDERDSD